MEELLNKIDNLKTALDKNSTIIDIKDLNSKILCDKKLLNKIEKYKVNKSDKLQKEIYNNKLYMSYKKKETDLNILIMEINQKLKEINNRGSCR